MTFLTLLFLFFGQSMAYNSCQAKLEQKKWPIDCFLALKLKKTNSRSKAYTLLDEWCQIYQDDLSQHKPPKAIFQLNLPPNCLKLAQKSQEHHDTIEILKGVFLNSFL